MWELYDALIDGIPRHLLVEEMTNNGGTTYIRSDEGVGIGVTFNVDTRPPIMTEDILGCPLYLAAECVKSWNLSEASVGHAAINAYYNSLRVASANGVPILPNRYGEDRLNDPFISYQREIQGKTVGVVGHFNYLEKLFAPKCNLYIFEKDIYPGDHPESATEYLLPECDYVFIASGCIGEKTMPRYLELAKDAYVVVVGPSTTLAPVFLDFGVNDLAGFIVKDSLMAKKIVSASKRGKIYTTGQKVSFKSSQYAPLV